MSGETSTTPPDECPQDFLIAGIGASAGGLEACSTLLRNLPEKSGLAVVVVQHLDPRHESSLPQLLGKVTQIPVTLVQDDRPVQPNHVYVLPPNFEVIIAEGVLRLIPRETRSHQVPLPIDAFFRSLAENCRHRAIGVVLSGTGSDGSLGLEAIKAAGGFTFAQDTESARFEGMPQSASGAADFILPPADIAAKLVEIASFPYDARLSQVMEENGDSKDFQRLQPVLELLHGVSGIDFSQYRSTTVQRRILRRMALNQISDLDAYYRLLLKQPGEVTSLCEEMIPRVTKFFRDPEVFGALEQQVLPAILNRATKAKPIRIWVPGCASGEEVYAIAISLLEFLTDKVADFQLQIFGTDLSSLAIQTARKGLYARKIEEDVSPERLKRFFTPRQDGYQATAALREVCIFATHDLTKNPPYSRLDLISCRNVLIYLDAVQSRVIQVFHYALNPGGFLVLGKMETARRFSDLFTPVDAKLPIYKKSGAVSRPLPRWESLKGVGSVIARIPDSLLDGADVQRRADRAVLAKYAPAGVVVDDSWQVLQVRGQVAPWLEPAPGKMSANILSLAKRSGLALELAAALEQAKNDNAPVRKENLEVSPGNLRFHLQVIPLRNQEPRLYAVLFEQAPKPVIETANAEQESLVPKSEFLNLQTELVAVKSRLVAVFDSHQQYTEEAQSVQAENLSNLEELQSFNEELETAKEELQSTNEELSTVNEELNIRNTDLRQSRDFAASIVEAVLEPLVVFDRDLCIQRANRSFHKTFRLSPEDTHGHHLYEMCQNAWDFPALRQVLDKVSRDGQAFEGVEVEHQFPIVGRRILRLYARHLEGSELLLLALEDITDSRAAEAELRRVQDELRQGQKMEAIGRLAGGVAHDFNNILTGVIGFSELLMQQLEAGTESFGNALEIFKSGERAAKVTQQLLAFSRRQMLHPQAVDLNGLILEMDAMLTRLIGSGICVNKALGENLWPLLADPGQINQVILNLTLNARDAMPGGGTLTIKTENTRVGEEPIRSLRPGDYVTLSVFDSGDGMDQETQRQMFEPFFTTKPQGLSTGLGLATVFGIVQQSGGSIQVKSELGTGTTFWVDLPKAETAPAIKEPRAIADLPKGTETILVVEDEDAIRRLIAQTLTAQGYTILAASHGAEALVKLQAAGSGVDLLLTDMIMPGEFNGRQLAQRVLELQPGMRTLLMSGYTTDDLAHYGVSKGVPFLKKPYTLEQLTGAVRAALDAAPVPI